MVLFPVISRKFLYWLLAGVFFLLVLGGVIFYRFYIYSDFPVSTDPLVVLYKELDRNQKFVAGYVALESGNQTEAYSQFRQAYEIATDPDEEGYLKYLAGRTNPSLAQGIKELKAVVQGNGYTPMARAYALDAIGSRIQFAPSSLWSSFVFSEPPYSFFYDGGNRELGLRRLAEYASSYYPTPSSEYEIAFWYAKELYTLKRQNAQPTIQNETKLHLWRTIIAERLKNGNILITYPLLLPERYRSITSEALLLKARVLSTLTLSTEVGVEAPEPIFKSLLTSSDQSVALRARIYYALFLNNFYGDRRQAEIMEVLSPLYEPDAFGLIADLVESGKDASIGTRRDLLQIAAIDPRFKQHLLQTGWKLGDFE